MGDNSAKHPPSLPLGCKRGPPFSHQHRDNQGVQENPRGRAHSPDPLPHFSLLHQQTSPPHNKLGAGPVPCMGARPRSPHPASILYSCPFRVRSENQVVPRAHHPKAPASCQPLRPQPPRWSVYLRLNVISGSSLIFCGRQNADHLCLSSTK